MNDRDGDHGAGYTPHGAPGVHEESTMLRAGDIDVPVLLFRPDDHAPVAGVVVAPEAQGINHFIRDVGTRLAREGYLAAVPDYYHGHGPEDPDRLTSLAHLPVIQGAIDALDFRQGSEDMLAAVDLLHGAERLEQVAVWGYCTGGTLAMMAACQGRSVEAAVLFYPSQPRFSELTAKRPQHPIDLVWQLRKPMLLVVGDEDPVWPADLIADIAHRCDQWSIPLEVSVYEGAGHTFAGHFEDWHRPGAAAEAWVQAIDFLGRCLS